MRTERSQETDPPHIHAIAVLVSLVVLWLLSLCHPLGCENGSLNRTSKASWTNSAGGDTVCRRGWFGVAAEPAELALVHQVDGAIFVTNLYN
mgnify:CR=1 FL=1